MSQRIVVNPQGVVGADDYVVWRNKFGQAGAGLAADGDGNHQIDGGNYDVWHAHFGQTAASGSTAPGSAGGFSAAVPEPAAFLLLTVGAIMAFAVGLR